MTGMKLYVLNNGRLENDLANLIAMPYLGTVDNKTPSASWVPVPVYSILIEHPDGLVLFDAACHPDAMTERWDVNNKKMTPYYYEEENLLPNALSKIGYKPNDIKYLVVSHLHKDHAGCLEMFTHSQVFVHDDELMKTLRLVAINGNMVGYIRKDIEQWLNIGMNWNTIENDEGDIQLLEGITILNFGPGHAFGMLGLLVELPKEGNILLASDAINTKTNIGPPIVYPGLVYDSRGYYSTIKRIARLSREKNAEIWYGHDMEQFNILKKSDEGYYE